MPHDWVRKCKCLLPKAADITASVGLAWGTAVLLLSSAYDGDDAVPFPGLSLVPGYILLLANDTVGTGQETGWQARPLPEAAHVPGGWLIRSAQSSPNTCTSTPPSPHCHLCS